MIAFASGVLPNLYAFYRYTRNSTYLYHTLATQFYMLTVVKPLALTYNLGCHLHSLYAQLFRITLATYVLPRLLAHSLP